jgi:hypothetical protein
VREQIMKQVHGANFLGSTHVKGDSKEKEIIF